MNSPRKTALNRGCVYDEEEEVVTASGVVMTASSLTLQQWERKCSRSDFGGTTCWRRSSIGACLCFVSGCESRELSEVRFSHRVKWNDDVIIRFKMFCWNLVELRCFLLPDPLHYSRPIFDYRQWSDELPPITLIVCPYDFPSTVTLVQMSLQIPECVECSWLLSCHVTLCNSCPTVVMLHCKQKLNEPLEEI